MVRYLDAWSHRLHVCLRGGQVEWARNEDEPGRVFPRSGTQRATDQGCRESARVARTSKQFV